MTRQRQTGYTIVEIGIVLVVMSMVASGMLLGYANYLQDERVRKTEATMELAKDALVRYAASHRTSRMFLVNNNAAATQRVRWEVPSGRPYLPCPDVDADGREDRTGYISPRVRVPATRIVTIPVSVTVLTLATSGCAAYKGALPWRDLGSAPLTDDWGRPFTYRVAPAYADRHIGFDEQMAAGGGVLHPAVYKLGSHNGQRVIIGPDARLSNALIAGMLRVAITTAVTISASVRFNVSVTEVEFFSNDNPAIICASAPCNAASTARIQGEMLLTGVVTRATIVRGSGTNTSTRVIVSTTGIDMRPVSRLAADYPVLATFGHGAMFGGVPVVLVSHGENGYGAWDFPAGCNLPGATDDLMSDDEKQNAFRHLPNPLPDTYKNCQLVLRHGQENGFVKRPISDDFDDVVTWMSTEDLADRLADYDVFPVRKLPPVGLEAH